MSVALCNEEAVSISGSKRKVPCRRPADDSILDSFSSHKAMPSTLAFGTIKPAEKLICNEWFKRSFEGRTKHFVKFEKIVLESIRLYVADALHKHQELSSKPTPSELFIPLFFLFMAFESRVQETSQLVFTVR